MAVDPYKQPSTVDGKRFSFAITAALFFCWIIGLGLGFYSGHVAWPLPETIVVRLEREVIKVDFSKTICHTYKDVDTLFIIDLTNCPDPDDCSDTVGYHVYWHIGFGKYAGGPADSTIMYIGTPEDNRNRVVKEMTVIDTIYNADGEITIVSEYDDD